MESCLVLAGFMLVYRRKHYAGKRRDLVNYRQNPASDFDELTTGGIRWVYVGYAGILLVQHNSGKV